jgi:hypothetical protein
MAVLQRAEDKKSSEQTWGHKIGSSLAPMISQVFSIPNVFEMAQFTSCICLVFNQAGLSIDEVMKISGDYRRTFEQVRQSWEAGGKGRRFQAMCPYDQDGKSLSPQFQSFSESCKVDRAILGPNPLIVVIGHCSPGSSTISGDKDTGLHFSVTQVRDVIRPLMITNCTIFLTPCSTAVGKGTALSFQDTLMSTMATGNPEAYVIGMNSTSVPVGGTVLSTGYTVKHTQSGALSVEQFKSRQEWASTPAAIVSPSAHVAQVPSTNPRGRKVRVVTYIPTAEEAKRGMKEKYHYEYR